jgi:hypothetical protein
MSETETTTIDEKKAEDSGATTDKADWKGFTKNFSNGLITGIFFGVVVIGSMGLFLAKVANANILPTNCDLEPYPLKDENIDENKVREVAMDIIYMNPVKILGLFGLKFWEEPTSDTYFIQEANFVNDKAKLNFMNDFKNSWLCTLKNKAYPKKDGEIEKMSSGVDNNGIRSISRDDMPKNSPFWAYEFETMKSMTCTSFSIINKVFFYMNYLPEWATMILFALFFSVIITIIFIANMLCGIWDHVSNFGELIKNLYNFNKFNGQAPDLEEEALPFYKKWSTITNILYVMLYFIASIYSAIIISPVVVTLYTFFKALGANYVVRDKNYKGLPEDAPKLNVFSFIKSALYYKKTFIIILVMLNLMGATNQYLGSSYLPGVIIALVILIFGLKILNIDRPENLFPVLNSNFPPLSQPKVNLNNETPVKICNNKEENYSNFIPKITKSITGYWGPNVFETNTTKPSSSSYSGGGRAIKNIVSNVSNPKPKTKIYNLKLV